MLPVLLVLVDLARGTVVRNRIRVWLRARAPVFALLAVTAVIFMRARTAVLGTLSPTYLDPVLEVTPRGLPRVLTASQIWPEILRLLFVPYMLLADYGPRILLPLTDWNARALFGLGIVAALALDSLRARTRVQFAVRALVAVAIALFAVRTVTRIPEWRSTDDIFRALLRDRPDSFRAHWHHARMGWRDGDHEAALRHFDQAIAGALRSLPLHARMCVPLCTPC